MDIYKSKYQKYKRKYMQEIKNQKGGKLDNLSVVSYNVFGGGKLKEHRIDTIVSEIKKYNPTVICLQEATKDVIDAIMVTLPGFHLFTKREVLDIGNMSPEDVDATDKDGYLAILSKYEYMTKDLIYEGNWYDDGIMRVKLNSEEDLGFNLVVYNVHLVGGTFGKSDEVVKLKRKIRKVELQTLNSSLLKDDNITIIMGDFNSDSNDDSVFPEIKYYPENVLRGYHDVWYKLKQKGKPKSDEQDYVGATESYNYNKFRAHLKPGQNRESRFDKIIYSGKITPTNIVIIGNNLIKEVGGVPVFPSDHFGLQVSFSIQKID